MIYIINFFKSMISLGETISFYIAKAVGKALYGLLFAYWQKAEKEADQIKLEYKLKRENLELREKELEQKIKEVDEIKNDLEDIQGIDGNSQTVIKDLYKQIEELEKKLSGQREKITRIKDLEERLSYAQLKAKKTKELEKQLAILNGKQTSESPLVQSLRTELVNLRETVELLKKSGKSGIPLKANFKELKTPKLNKVKNPLKNLLNWITYKKEMRKFDALFDKLNKVEFNFIKESNTKRFSIKINSKSTAKLKPESITEKERHLVLNDKYVRIYYLADLPTFLSSYALFNLINSRVPFRLSMFTTPFPTGALIKKIQGRVSNLETEQTDRMEKGKKRDLKLDKEIDEGNELAQKLTMGTEKGYLASIYVGIEASSKKKLLAYHKEFTNITDQIEFTFNTYSYGQRKAFEALLPFNNETVGKDRLLQTTAISYLTPFLSKQINDPQGIFLGFNAYNGSLVLVDFFNARNKNINIFGTSGSGKSVTAKLMALRLYLRGIQTLVIDPEGEYKQLAKAIGGEVIEFTRDNGINPFYVGSSARDDIMNHIDMLMTFFKFFISASNFDASTLNKTLTKMYDYGSPSYSELLKLLKGNKMQDDLTVLTEGSLRGIFNSEKELQLDNDFIVFDISSLDSENKKSPAMYLLTSLIWNIVNKDSEKATRRRKMLFIDEAHTLLRDKQVAAFYMDIVKRARKRNLGVVSITQNVEDFVDNVYGKGIISNAETTILLKQQSKTVSDLGDIFNITEEEKEKLPVFAIGESVMFRENEHVRLNIHPLPSEFELVKT